MGYANRIVQTEICALRSAHLPPLLQSQEAVGNYDTEAHSQSHRPANSKVDRPELILHFRHPFRLGFRYTLTVDTA